MKEKEAGEREVLCLCKYGVWGYFEWTGFEGRQVLSSNAISELQLCVKLNGGACSAAVYVEACATEHKMSVEECCRKFNTDVVQMSVEECCRKFNTDVVQVSGGEGRGSVGGARRGGTVLEGKGGALLEGRGGALLDGRGSGCSRV
ncbi:UNVERIFIED_CONTAM: hypothetical protein FKN15_054698 [Acipenser sinensis]